MIQTILPDSSRGVKASKRKIKRIAFLGGSTLKPEDPDFIAAQTTARLLVEEGYNVINGGGPGIMRASTIGGKEAGGYVLAVTYHPSVSHKNFEGVDKKNLFDEEIVTMDYFDRTKVMLQNADCHLIFNGATGTLSEFGMSWASSRIHQGHHKPIILYGEFWNHIIEEIETHMHLRSGEKELLKVLTTPEGVVEYVKSFG
jgi:uncharacterized protein (TIGR00725 family)